MLAAVALLDLLTPPEVDFGEFYIVPVVIVAWASGWRAGVAFAALSAATGVIADSGLFRSVDAAPATTVVVWNTLSDFLIFTVVALVIDRLYRERKRWRAVNGERARLLRLLEREFPRPLRAIDWFARTFEDTVRPELALSDQVHDQFGALRHHVREVNFLATDLIRIGRLNSGELTFAQNAIDLKPIAADAANQVLDRNRVLFSASTEPLIVRADPEPLHHAISAVIGRLLESSPPHEVVHVFARGSDTEGVVEFTSRAVPLEAEAFELADLLAQANGGRLVVIPRGSDLGVRICLYIPRADAAAPEPSASPSVSARG